MSELEQGVVVGIFEERRDVIHAIDTLINAGFHEQQLGFASRSHEQHVVHAQQKMGPGAITRGVVGGLMGVVDMLLVPITGPADAAGILATALPVTEEAIDHLPYPGSKNDEKPL